MTDYDAIADKSVDRAYRDPDLLHYLHWEKELCYREMANELDCSKRTIRRWMNRLDVEHRTPEEGYRLAQSVNYASYTHNADGHPMWSVHDPVTQKGKTFTVHRLLAIAEYGTDAVKGTDVHHKNNIPFDNRAENIELVSKSDHAKIHKPWEDSPIIP